MFTLLGRCLAVHRISGTMASGALEDRPGGTSKFERASIPRANVLPMRSRQLADLEEARLVIVAVRSHFELSDSKETMSRLDAMHKEICLGTASTLRPTSSLRPKVEDESKRSWSGPRLPSASESLGEIQGRLLQPWSPTD